MKEFICNVAQKGFFAGPVFFIRPAAEAESELFTDAESETDKLHQAEAAMKNSITQKRMSGENAEIQETVLSILEDASFTGKIEQNIRDCRLSASAAVEKTAAFRFPDIFYVLTNAIVR